MSSLKRVHLVGFGFVVVATFAAGKGVVPVSFEFKPPPVVLPGPVRDLLPGVKLSSVIVLPEEVSALTAARTSVAKDDLWLYIATTGTGGVYRIDTITERPLSVLTIAKGLGDQFEYATCGVNCLAVHDMDHDGTMELLVSTSQIQPRGRPRLYLWTLSNPPILRGVARPEITSSWGHGIGVVPARDGGPDSAFLTYCGFGEVLEYRPVRDQTAGGFTVDALSWKQVGQLPASGEHATAADADNDGRIDLCLATGFAPGKAAIQIVETGAAGVSLTPRHLIDEGGRFANVRFLVGASRPDALHDVFAWWCTDPSGGDCEIIRYRLGPEGVRGRAVLGAGAAADLWPRDNQTTLADLDGDGHAEVWFATNSGNLWRLDDRSNGWSRVLRLEAGIGPVLAVPAHHHRRPALYLASGCHLLHLEAP